MDTKAEFSSHDTMQIWNHAANEQRAAVVLLEVMQSGGAQSCVHILEGWRLVLKLCRLLSKNSDLPSGNLIRDLNPHMSLMLTASEKETWEKGLAAVEHFVNKRYCDDPLSQPPNQDDLFEQSDILFRALRSWKKELAKHDPVIAQRGRRLIRVGIILLFIISLIFVTGKLVTGSYRPSIWFAIRYNGFDITKWEQGWGRLHFNRSVEGNRLSCGGKIYEQGLGAHSESQVYLRFPDKFKSFSGLCCIDDEVGSAGSVIFRIYSEDRLLFESPLVRGGEPPRSFSVPVAGLNSLRLSISGTDDGAVNDHADWLALTLK